VTANLVNLTLAHYKDARPGVPEYFEELHVLNDSFFKARRGCVGADGGGLRG
jgi:hypothetical protein